MVAVFAICPGEERRQPNVVVLLADDLGWGDLGCHGNTNLSTPNIDSLARDGAILENFYVCAVCAPTRAEFLTGRYHFRGGVSGVSEGSERLNPEEITLADVFRRAGYATGAFGKWHNGTQAPYHPLDRGFDEFYGFTSGHWGHYFSPPLEHNRTRVRGEGYLTDDLTDRAIGFIEKNRDRPFLCYVPLNTPHSPFYVDDRFYEKFEGFVPAMRHRDRELEDLAVTRAVLAMCENIDWNVGRILQSLDDWGLRNDTIVLFFSDNGPNSYRWNGGMKGKKASVDEGGLRSPFLIRWPDRIPAGRTYPVVAGAIDLLPTLTRLAGIPGKTGKPLDGVSFHEYLLGGEPAAGWPDRHLFSVRRKKATVRTDRFRLDPTGKLFDVQRDREQRSDVSADFPEVALALSHALAEHQREAAVYFEANADRPFTVGYASTTTLPARDGRPHGGIERSSRAPNNSFFRNWRSAEDWITWDVRVGVAGSYRATVYHTCPPEGVGTRVALEFRGASTSAVASEAFDPPLWDKSKERVAESHYYVKDFRPLDLGLIRLEEGRGVLRLFSPEVVGGRGIDVYSLVLEQVDVAR